MYRRQDSSGRELLWLEVRVCLRASTRSRFSRFNSLSFDGAGSETGDKPFLNHEKHYDHR